MRLPPLNSLRAFEAAARYESFLRASKELNVTPAAVSQQVKQLESILGEDLFTRQPRGIKLTEVGREILPQLSRGFDHFQRALSTLGGGELNGRLIVSTAPSFAILWLVPRLQSFIQAFPEIEVRLIASDLAHDLHSGEVDIRIPYGLGDYPGLKTTLLMRESIFPVCAPSLLNRLPLRRFSDLQYHRLLHDFDTGESEPTMTWKRWLRDADLGTELLNHGVEFSNSVLVTEAAVQGQGVALGRTSLVKSHLVSGRLVRPLKVSRPADYAYYLVTTQAGVDKPRIRAFTEWLQREAEDDGNLAI